MNTINRLQLRHHTPIFETREAAIEYIYSQIRFADEGLAFEDKRYGFSLLGEPTVLLYKNVTEADPTGENDPHLIFVIGSATNEGTQYNDNRFCIIDIDKTEKEIEDLWEELEKAIKSLGIFTRDTNTLKLYSEKTEDGTIISGDVVVATSQIFDDARKPNVILSTDDGLFTYVNMEYDKDNDLLTFTVNGETKQWLINNNYLVGGWYSKKDESLHLKSKDESEIVISLENLIDEWGVEGEASNTPIVLTREEVGYGNDSLHNHVEPWQDVLKADVRLADRKYNILKKTSDGRYLYVDGLANNITFFKDGEEMTVQEALANAIKSVSNDSTNIIYEKADGYYATAALKYFNKENKLVFTTSNVTGGTTTEEIKLNSVEAFKKIVYDPVTESLIIMYIDGNGDIQECDVPIGQMMQDWEWDIVNDGHNVKLHKQRVVGGNDKVSADAAIYNDPDNILVDKNHELFVKGTADNIRYGKDSNVSDELNKLNANDADLTDSLDKTNSKLDAEITRSTEKDNEHDAAITTLDANLSSEVARSTDKDTEHDNKITTLQDTIGTGFSTDTHETITYKFNELSSKVVVVSANTETNEANIGLISARTESEIVRAKGEEARLEKKFDDALGEGFHIRNSVRDELDKEKADRAAGDAALKAEIDNLSANTEGRLIDVINTDGSIHVDKTNAVKPNINVVLSEEIEDGKSNIIKLNADGLYAGVDLDYYFESGTSKNVLVFKTTNGTKTFDLKTNSVVDKIYYDPTKEVIIIEYTVDGHRMEDVEVPVHDLINEWRVSESTNGAIKLSKTRESGATQDVLYAESVIATHEDNILRNDDGALYVSRKPITDLEKRMEDAEGRLDAAETDIDSLEINLSTETTARVSADTALDTKINDEIARAVSAETTTNTKLDNEITRSIDKDNALELRINTNQANITKEIQDRITSDETLHDEVITERDRATTAEASLRNDLDTEIQARADGDRTLQANIDAETQSRKNVDESLQSQIDTVATDLSTERSERISSDDILDKKIIDERNRATEAENLLRTDLNAEITRATTSESNLSNAITQESNRAISAETDLKIILNDEITRSTDKDNALDHRIDDEANARSSEDTRIWYDLNNNKLLFEDTNSVDFTRTYNEGVADVIKADVKLSSKFGNVLSIKDGEEAGLYSTAILKYNSATNVLGLYDDNDVLVTEQKLGAGSLLDSIEYDKENKNLIIKYHNADGTLLETTLGVADLFNEWLVQNPTTGSAVELWKTSNTTESGTIDYISGRVLVTAEINQDGTVEYGDNIIRIVNNGLYVPGSGITRANEIAECTREELKVVENAVLGKNVTQKCGEGYVYEPNALGCFISAATSMQNADELLDTAACENRNRIVELEEDVACLQDELDVTQQDVLGFVIPACGKNADGSMYKYEANINTCFIKDAKNMNEADIILDDYVCSAHTRIDVLEEKIDCMSGETKSVETVLGIKGNCSDVINYPATEGCLLSSASTFAQADEILEKAICGLLGAMFVGNDTPTTSMYVIEEGLNRYLATDVRLSHGNTQMMGDEDFTITDYKGDAIEEGYSDFTDTNVLRIVDLTESEGMIPESKYNGLYLSNVWNCGQYTLDGEGTPFEKYRTDESETAMNHFNRRYRNRYRR